MRSDDLPRGSCLWIVQIACRDGQWFFARMDFAVTGGAIGVSRILDLDKVGFELTIFVEGLRRPGPCTVSVVIADNSQADQSRRISAAEGAFLDECRHANLLSGFSR